jgi:ATP-binding protein involved in chromosome partitioning
VDIPVLGLIENMSYFVCDGCGKEHEIFSRGGGAKAARKLKLDFLGEIPILPEIRESCDAGIPIVARDPDGAAAKAFGPIVDKLVERVARCAVEAEEASPKLQLVD